jgi:hypothetical protein
MKNIKNKLPVERPADKILSWSSHCENRLLKRIPPSLFHNEMTGWVWGKYNTYLVSIQKLSFLNDSGQPSAFSFQQNVFKTES